VEVLREKVNVCKYFSNISADFLSTYREKRSIERGGREVKRERMKQVW
jgi:hypothetical protein